MATGLRRIAAWLIDCVCILCWAAVVAAVAVPLYRAGVIRSVDTLSVNVISAVVLVTPVVLAAAWSESRPRAATPGKRLLGLTVTSPSGAPPFRSALLRNALKIGAPWLIGHAAVFTIVRTGDGGSVPPAVWGLTIASYAVPLLWLSTLLLRDGRTPYDRIARTTVGRAESVQARRGITPPSISRASPRP